MLGAIVSQGLGQVICSVVKMRHRICTALASCSCRPAEIIIVAGVNVLNDKIPIQAGSHYGRCDVCQRFVDLDIESKDSHQGP